MIMVQSVRATPMRQPCRRHCTGRTGAVPVSGPPRTHVWTRSSTSRANSTTPRWNNGPPSSGPPRQLRLVRGIARQGRRSGADGNQPCEAASEEVVAPGLEETAAALAIEEPAWGSCGYRIGAGCRSGRPGCAANGSSLSPSTQRAMPSGWANLELAISKSKRRGWRVSARAPSGSACGRGLSRA